MTHAQVTTSPQVAKIENQAWAVVWSDGSIAAGPFQTNAEAWRALDRFDGEPTNPAESRSEWIATNILKS